MRKYLPLNWTQLEAARAAPFSAHVLGGDWIVCLECGARRKIIAGLHLKQHGLTSEAYREKWGYATGQPLACERLCEELRQRSKKRVKPLDPVRRTASAGWTRKWRPQSLRSAKQAGRQRKLKNRRNPGSITMGEVLELHRQGLTNAEIAARLGCTKAPVWSRLKEAGVAPNLSKERLKKSFREDVSRAAIMELRRKGMNLAEVAEALGCSPKLVNLRIQQTGGNKDKTLAAGYRRDITTEMVVKAHRSGMGITAMMEQFGCSAKVIYNRLRDAGDPQGSGGFGATRPLKRPDIRTEDVVDLYRGGMSSTEIAVRLNCSHDTVATRLKEAGMRTDLYKKRVGPNPRLDITNEEIRRMRASGMELDAIAAQFRCRKGLIQRRLRESGGDPLRGTFGRKIHLPVKRKDISIEAVAEAWNAGQTMQQIADRFACTVGLVRDRLRRGGVLTSKVKRMRKV